MKPPVEDRFEIDISWSNEDGAYIAVVPSILYSTAWSESYEEALAQVRVAIRANIETTKELGHPVPQPKARSIT